MRVSAIDCSRMLAWWLQLILKYPHRCLQRAGCQSKLPAVNQLWSKEEWWCHYCTLSGQVTLHTGRDAKCAMDSCFCRPLFITRCTHWRTDYPPSLLSCQALSKTVVAIFACIKVLRYICYAMHLCAQTASVCKLAVVFKRLQIWRQPTEHFCAVPVHMFHGWW